MTCARCAKRDAVPLHDLCRACRYYGRGRYETNPMRVVNVRLPSEVLDALLAEAAANGETFAATLRARLKAGMS